MLQRLIVIFILLLLSSCSEPKSTDKTEPVVATTIADTILINGNIYSLDWDEPALDGTPSNSAPYNETGWHADAEAIAISNGEILFVGKSIAAKQYEGKLTQVIDLKGATVIPGLVDSHVHIAEFGELLQRVNLTDIPTPEAAVIKLKEYATNLKTDDWVIGQGWDEGAWANNYPNRQILDEAFPDNPVYLKSLHGFAVWVNSKALEIVQIDKDTKAPVGGEIVRDDTGVPTGILLNRATTLVADKIPQPSIDKFAEYIKDGMQQMAKDGFVAIHQAGAETLHIAALEQLQKNNMLPIRMYAMLSARDKDLSEIWLKKGPLIDPEGFLDIRAVKAYYDGALGSRGARLIEDYSDREGHRGVSGEGYGFDSEIVDKMIEAGFQVGVHAIGDAGNRETLAYFAKSAASNTNMRHRIEHAQVVHPDDFKYFKNLNIIASMEPPHAVEDKTWAEERLGSDRIKGAYAWRTLRLEGVPLTFNSDLPGSDHNIFYGLHSAIQRQDKKLQPMGGWHPEQTVTIEEAIRGYTNWAAYSAFREKQTGLLKTGYWADL
ncbi:MAG: amidohydrolase, partial [Gammaproteobacteria bacterium]|nr:amidohydrolase [Gammaproteobacteria bacterium]